MKLNRRQVTRLLGTNPARLNYWEGLGVLRPARHRRFARRAYCEADVAALRALLALRRLASVGRLVPLATALRRAAPGEPVRLVFDEAGRPAPLKGTGLRVVVEVREESDARTGSRPPATGEPASSRRTPARPSPKPALPEARRERAPSRSTRPRSSG
jgi:hypothetical protein